MTFTVIDQNFLDCCTHLPEMNDTSYVGNNLLFVQKIDWYNFDSEVIIYDLNTREKVAEYIVDNTNGMFVYGDNLYYQDKNLYVITPKCERYVCKCPDNSKLTGIIGSRFLIEIHKGQPEIQLISMKDGKVLYSTPIETGKYFTTLVKINDKLYISVQNKEKIQFIGEESFSLKLDRDYDPMVNNTPYLIKKSRRNTTLHRLNRGKTDLIEFVYDKGYSMTIYTITKDSMYFSVWLNNKYLGVHVYKFPSTVKSARNFSSE